MREKLKHAKRWVIKLGTSMLTTPDGHFSMKQLEQIAGQVNALLREKIEVILVSSGAIALGMETLKRSKRPKELSELQACAAIGQGKLMRAYETAFSSHGFHTAQILLTRDGLQDRTRYVNAKRTIETLLRMNIIPIVNENDTVATEEIKFGDNDVLAAQVANMTEASLLVLLSDVDGFYLRDKTLVRQIHSSSELKEYASHIYEKQNEKTAGGMKTKLEAAQAAMRSGIPIMIANGRDPHVMDRILKGEEVGSLFYPVSGKTNARKKWLANSASAKGTLTVDPGAYRALAEGKKSLLAGGVTELSGVFEVGDSVKLQNEEGLVFALGLVNYSSHEIQKIKGRKTHELPQILGYKRSDELIHRNNLVFLE